MSDWTSCNPHDSSREPEPPFPPLQHVTPLLRSLKSPRSSSFRNDDAQRSSTNCAGRFYCNPYAVQSTGRIISVSSYQQLVEARSSPLYSTSLVATHLNLTRPRLPPSPKPLRPTRILPIGHRSHAQYDQPPAECLRLFHNHSVVDCPGDRGCELGLCAAGWRAERRDFGVAQYPGVSALLVLNVATERGEERRLEQIVWILLDLLELAEVVEKHGCRPYYYSSKREEYAHIKFDLDIDLSHLFTWNTKQIFLYITASYPPTNTPNPSAPFSKSIIWDAILPHPLAPVHENQYTYLNPNKVRRSSKKDPAQKTQSTPHVPGILKLDSQAPKYQITDPSGMLADRANATLELGWNIQPWVGMLTWGTADAKPYAAATRRAPFWYRIVPRFLTTWRSIAGEGARSARFGFPDLRDRNEAAGAAGGLGTEKGGEKNRGSPA
ncbi:MAG: hypothetical protein M1831_001231 [Alyxoria varia]|nr:MAG: hypothetical protein M1831_001231 [Alyxoria varia]